MNAILSAFWNIVIFRAGPRDLPDSRPLLVVAALMYAGSDVLILVASLFGQRELSGDALPLPSVFSGVILPLLADMGLLVACMAGVLAYTGYSGRLQRSLTALFGAQAVLQLLTWPAFMLLLIESLAEVWFLLILFLLLAVLWSIAVYAHILAQATERTFGICVALAALYFLLNYQLVQLIPDF